MSGVRTRIVTTYPNGEKVQEFDHDFMERTTALVSDLRDELAHWHSCVHEPGEIDEQLASIPALKRRVRELEKALVGTQGDKPPSGGDTPRSGAATGGGL